MSGKQRRRRKGYGSSKTPYADKTLVGNFSKPNEPKALSSLFQDYETKRPAFSFCLVDRKYEGEWGWHLLDNEGARKLFDFIFDMSQLTWNTICNQATGSRRRHFKHHVQAIAGLSNEAQKRLEHLQLDVDQENIFRFRLGGEERLWGFRNGSMFHVLWWDPGHKVYPTDPS